MGCQKPPWVSRTTGVNKSRPTVMVFINVYFFSSVNQVAPKVRKVLQLFRLKQINNGVFVKLNKVNY